MNEKCKEIFNKEMSNKDIEPLERLSKAISGIQEEVLKECALWARLNFVCNITNKMPIDDINWKNVNEILFKDQIPYDYNLVDSVNNIEELNNLRLNVIAAGCGIGAWYKSTCKDCGEEFYLCKDEIEYFLKKELDIPKRCYECRKKRAKPEKKIIQSVKPEPQRDPTCKTNMQIAMEKAGII